MVFVGLAGRSLIGRALAAVAQPSSRGLSWAPAQDCSDVGDRDPKGAGTKEQLRFKPAGATVPLPEQIIPSLWVPRVETDPACQREALRKSRVNVKVQGRKFLWPVLHLDTRELV